MTTTTIFGQWDFQVSQVLDNLNDVYCVTEDLVFVVGENGRILKTSDGGVNWVVKTSGTTQQLNRVQFANASIGYAVGNNGTILKTIDSGENWAAITTTINNHYSGLSVVDQNTFFVSGNGGLVQKSIDGGVSFTSLNIQSTNNVLDIQFFGEQIGYAQVGYSDQLYKSGILLKTTDGGTNWSIIVNDNVYSFHFLNENIGFINNENKSLFKTTNGGQNFAMMYSNYGYVVDLYTSNENLVWNIENRLALCGCDNTVINKMDFDPLGSISESYFGPSGNLSSIYFVNETTGYTVGKFGEIYKNTNGINTSTIPYNSVSQFEKKNSNKYCSKSCDRFFENKFQRTIT